MMGQGTIALSRFRADIETERLERVDSARLQLNAIRQIVSHLRAPRSADFA
jgi:F-type H+-transporting ATPase subunit epsilon